MSVGAPTEQDHDHEQEAHGHGAPFTWEPDDPRRRKGLWLIVAGIAFVALGAYLCWLGLR